MSMALTQKVKELERRIEALEKILEQLKAVPEVQDQEEPRRRGRPPKQ